MNKEQSFGVIPLRKTKEGIEVLMVQHRKGHWGFPKGHQVREEQAQQSAQRELLEETGLSIAQWIPNISFSETYQFSNNGSLIDKTVYYFPAFVEGEVHIQEEELVRFAWSSPSSLSKLATFPEMKRVCRDIESWLQRPLEVS